MSRPVRLLLIIALLLAVASFAYRFLVRRGRCTTHRASMTLSATDTTLQVGDALTVTVSLLNKGCAKLGLPQYRLYAQSHEAHSVLSPDQPEPVVHSLAVAPGESDASEFELHAVGPGQATIGATASFEVHLGYPGPAYWTGASASPLVITVEE